MCVCVCVVDILHRDTDKTSESPSIWSSMQAPCVTPDYGCVYTGLSGLRGTSTIIQRQP